MLIQCLLQKLTPLPELQSMSLCADVVCLRNYTLVRGGIFSHTLCKLHKTSYYLRSDGMIERLNRTLLNMLNIATKIVKPFETWMYQLWCWHTVQVFRRLLGKVCSVWCLVMRLSYQWTLFITCPRMSNHNTGALRTSCYSLCKSVISHTERTKQTKHITVMQRCMVRIPNWRSGFTTLWQGN